MFEKRNQNKIRAKSARTQGIHRFHQFFYLGYGYVFYDDPWIIRTSSMPFFLKAPKGRQPDAKPIQKNLKFNLLTPVEKKDPKKGSCITRKIKIKKSKKWEIEKNEKSKKKWKNWISIMQKIARRKNESKKGASINKSTKSRTREVNLRRSRSDAGANYSNLYAGSGLIFLNVHKL